MVLPGARQESLRFTAEKTLSIKGLFSILFCWEVLAHLKAHTGCSTTGAAFGRDDALSRELLTAEGVVAFRIELGVGQHAADGSMLVRLNVRVGNHIDSAVHGCDEQ
ncbi:MAG: hypothetical protein ACYCPO_01315 [Acidobacteriaceae bacterium]